MQDRMDDMTVGVNRLRDAIDGFTELDCAHDGRPWTQHLAEHLIECGAVMPIRCRDCKHGQQVGGYGVLCEYGLEELRPMDHFCAWGEVRSFEPEDNEEE